MPSLDSDLDLREVPCPHCGEWAESRLLARETGRVEISCADCGRYEMTREAFDQAVSDMSEQEDRR